jgi:chorismate mutase / prephenate dehydratase
MCDLDKLRSKIDQIDQQLVKLLNERAQVVIEVGEFKRKSQSAPPVYAPDRERTVLDKIKSHNKGPLPDKTLIAIYRELMSGSFFLERPLRIAYLGPNGSFSHTAAILKFGQSVEYEPQPDIRGVFEEIAREHCDLGVVPVENTIAGGIIETLDSLMETSVSICAEVILAIHHNLLAKCKLDEVKKVYSKPEVFSQCRNWLAATLPNADIIQSASTAVAAQRVTEEPYAAAIGSKLAAELYNLTLVCENIEDCTNNVTRFFVIGRESARRTGDDKTAMVFSAADKAGALVDVLQAFRDYQVNLTNIESRPSRKRQKEYYFFADGQGHQDDDNVIKAVQAARKHCLQLTILGSFPRATEIL